MKKHLVLVVNTILVLAIVIVVGFVVFQAVNNKGNLKNDKPSDTKSTTALSKEVEGTTVQNLKTYTVGVIQHSDVDNCNNVFEGLSEKLESSFEYGSFVIDYALEEDNDKCKEEIQRFIDEDVDVIVAIGPFAANLAASMTSEIPIVFAAVQEPEKEGLVDTNEVPGKNVTGVSDYTPCFEQIYSIKQLIPDCKKIGAIYNGTDTGAVEQALMGKKEAQREDVDIAYAQYKVASESDIEEALDSMIADGVEVIYIPVDKYMASNLGMLVDFSYENKIPIVCGNMNMLKKGCFSTCVTNYEAIGIKVAEMIVNILANGADVSTSPVSYTNECYLHINSEAMEKLGLQVPASAITKAIIE